MVGILAVVMKILVIPNADEDLSILQVRAMSVDEPSRERSYETVFRRNRRRRSMHR